MSAKFGHFIVNQDANSSLRVITRLAESRRFSWNRIVICHSALDELSGGTAVKLERQLQLRRAGCACQELAAKPVRRLP